MSHSRLTVRTTGPSDAGTLRDLAALERRHSPRGHVLLAERDRAAVAAIAVTSGAIVSDPSDASADAVRSLRRARYHLLRQGTGSTRARRAVRRPVMAPAA